MKTTPAERRQIAKLRRRGVQICRMPGGPYQAEVSGVVLAEDGNLTRLLKTAKDENRKFLKAFVQLAGF